jgi:hypothetical protein
MTASDALLRALNIVKDYNLGKGKNLAQVGSVKRTAEFLRFKITTSEDGNLVDSYYQLPLSAIELLKVKKTSISSIMASNNEN